MSDSKSSSLPDGPKPMHANDAENKLAQASTSPYEQWGGYPATLAALDEFEATRASDPKLSAMFAKLDTLESAPRTADGLTAAMISCALEPEEVSHINSPLLDGLWKAVTGREPDGKTPLVANVMTNDVSFALRLIFPRLYLDTLRWFVRSVTVNSGPDGQIFEKTFAVAASLGQLEVIQLLVPFMDVQQEAHRETLSMAIQRAVCNGHLELLQTIFPLRNASEPSDRVLLMEAAEHDRIEVLQWLLQSLPSRTESFVDLYQALTAAVRANREAVVRYLLVECAIGKQVTALHYRALAKLTRSPINLGVFNALCDQAESAGLTFDWAAVLSSYIEQPWAESVDLHGFAQLIARLPPHVRLAIDETRLAASCSLGNLALVRLLISERIIASTDTALVNTVRSSLWFVRDGLQEFFQQLEPSLQCSADVIYCAAAVGDMSLVQYLLRHWARTHPNEAASCQQLAETQGPAGILSAAQVSRRDLGQLLQIAVTHGHLAGVTALLAHPSTVPRHDLDTAITRAIEHHQVAVVDCLLRWRSKEYSAFNGDDLEIPALVGDAAILQLMADCLRDLTVQLKYFHAASVTQRSLCAAAVRADFECCKVLLGMLQLELSMPPPLLQTLQAALAVAPSDGFQWLIVTLIECSMFQSIESSFVGLDRGYVLAATASTQTVKNLLLKAGANPRSRMAAIENMRFCDRSV